MSKEAWRAKKEEQRQRNMFDVNAMFKLSYGLFVLTAKEGEECNVSHRIVIVAVYDGQGHVCGCSV